MASGWEAPAKWSRLQLRAGASQSAGLGVHRAKPRKAPRGAWSCWPGLLRRSQWGLRFQRFWAFCRRTAPAKRREHRGQQTWRTGPGWHRHGWMV